MAENPTISRITLPSGTTYDVKDAFSREKIADIESAITGGVIFRGETSTAITDGATTNPITINDKSFTAHQGDLVVFANKEFVFDGEKWIELGDLSLLGDLAWKNSASGSYTPAGTVSQPSFTGESMTSTGNFTPEGSVAVSVGNGEANYTPAGTVSQPTFSGSELTSTGSYTPAGSVSQPSFTGTTMESTGNFTPSGTVSQPSFTGESMTSTGNFTPEGSVAVSVGNGEANYTPAGSVSKPDITVTPTTDNVYSITDVGTLPSLSTSVENEVLTIGFSQGTLPTKGAAQSVMTGASAALDNAPSFTGTGVDLEAAFTGTQGAVSVSGTPEGTVSQPSFSGTAATLSVSGTPAGTVSRPSFTGTGVDLEAAFTGTQGPVSVAGTPEGTVSQPTFSGTAATITVE